jgi:hypothetical protein
VVGQGFLWGLRVLPPRSEDAAVRGTAWPRIPPKGIKALLVFITADLRFAIRHAAQLEHLSPGLRHDLLTRGGSFDYAVGVELKPSP